MVSEREKTFNQKLTGGIGLGWIAIAIVWAAAIVGPNTKQVDCFVGVQAACAAIAETYVK